jgi:hypothetical protein
MDNIWWKDFCLNGGNPSKDPGPKDPASHAKMNASFITLCSPDAQKSCFACCPPIRPAGYEHRVYKNMIKRMLRENTAAFDAQRDRIVPITGFSCWALGYLDEAFQRVGCLLHPIRHGGLDLRYRVDYGNKCARETCPEAKVFDGLTIRERKCWLGLTAEFDSFDYSSRKVNPLFNLMGWGGRVLSLIAAAEKPGRFTREYFSETYPFFKTKALPRANAYVVNRLVCSDKVHLFRSTRFKDAFERFSSTLPSRLAGEPPIEEKAFPVHRLDLNRDFLDFLRQSLGISKTSLEQAVHLKEKVDEQCERFGRRLPS